jgi:hypothetical protein
MSAVLSLLLLLASDPAATRPGASPRPQSPPHWTTKPAATDLDACMPSVTDVGFGQVMLTCRVGPNGGLTACRAEGPNLRLREWALCLAPKFKTSPQRVGEQVEVPMAWKPAD